MTLSLPLAAGVPSVGLSLPPEPGLKVVGKGSLQRCASASGAKLASGEWHQHEQGRGHLLGHRQGAPMVATLSTVTQGPGGPWWPWWSW